MNLLKLIIEDLKYNGGKKPINRFLSIFFGQSFRLILNYRLGNYLIVKRVIFKGLILKILKKRQINKYACDISYQANIGRRIKFPHPIGIVVGTDVIIENDVMIWQHVTLGSITENQVKNYPTIKEGVKLFSACQILGAVVVNKGAKVGASALVLKDVPEYKTAVGVPAKII